MGSPVGDAASPDASLADGRPSWGAAPSAGCASPTVLFVYPVSYTLAMKLPDALVVFPDEKPAFLNMVLPWNWPDQGDWEAFQDGYRYSSVTDQNLTGEGDGQWRPGWWVIASNYFCDPFIIDTDEAETGYPVYHAVPGAGRWDLEQVAPTVSAFREILTILQDKENVDADGVDTSDLVMWVEASCGGTSKYWAEVLESYGSDDE